MRYALILATVLLAAPLAVSANQSAQDYCLQIAKDAENIATLRDDGVPFTTLMDAFGNDAVIEYLARKLYIENPRFTPEAAARGLYLACMEELT